MAKTPFTQGCDLRATFEWQEKWLGRSVVAHTQKVMFMCTCGSMTHVPSLNDQICCSGTTGRTKEAEWRQKCSQTGSRIAVVAEWRHSGHHSGRSMDAIGRHKEGKNVAQIDTQCSLQYYFFTGRPMANHCASILRPRRCVCLPPAYHERPVSDRPPRRPLCDCFEHAQNFTATMVSMTMSWRPVHYPWTTNATWPVQFLVTQGRHKCHSPCVKGV